VCSVLIVHKNELDSALWANDLPVTSTEGSSGGRGPARRLADEVRVATHDQLIAGTGQAHVEAFAGAFERGHFVDDEHDGTAFEPLEACPERICG
jgi:hypothetical protein